MAPAFEFNSNSRQFPARVNAYGNLADMIMDMITKALPVGRFRVLRSLFVFEGPLVIALYLSQTQEDDDEYSPLAY